jgi:hypothetical protein
LAAASSSASAPRVAAFVFSSASPAASAAARASAARIAATFERLRRRDAGCDFFGYERLADVLTRPAARSL